jgi:hypothetical protein
MLILNATHALDQQAVAPPWLFAPLQPCTDRVIGGDPPLKFGAGSNCSRYPTTVSIAQFGQLGQALNIVLTDVGPASS